MILAAVPLFSTVLPPLFDYPNHLARMHLLSEGGNQFYAVHWQPLPNLAQDLIVPPLAQLMPLDVASKLFLVAIFGLITGGTIWLNRVATGMWRLWPLLAFLLLYNRMFLWGFLNYLFGIGVALAGAALWLALERERWWLRTLASSLVALACYLSHIAAFGFYALVIIGIELSPAWGELRARRWPALGRRTAIAGTQFAIPAVLFFGYWHPAAAGGISYAAFWRKADLLFSVFDNYDRAFDIVCFALFLGLIGVARRNPTAPAGASTGRSCRPRLRSLSVIAEPDLWRLGRRPPAAGRDIPAADRRERGKIPQSAHGSRDRRCGGSAAGRPHGRHRIRLAASRPRLLG